MKNGGRGSLFRKAKKWVFEFSPKIVLEKNNGHIFAIVIIEALGAIPC